MYPVRSRFASLPFLCGCTLAASMLLPAGGAEAATRTVANCNDSGAGSLRAAVAAALSGDTIDLSRLGCSRIALTSGVITIPQATLSLVGRSRSALTIDGNRAGRVFNHTGTGTLRIRHLSIAHGRTASNIPEGGCIQSFGSVEMVRTRLHHCTALYTGSLDPRGAGGGLYAYGNVLFAYSAAFSNNVPEGPGGAIGAGDTVVLYRSQVYGNTGSDGGGVAAPRIKAVYSLIHGNTAWHGGGLYSEGLSDDDPIIEINKSTVSANRSNGGGGGFWASGWTRVLITDSSIVDNVALDSSAGRTLGGARIFNSTLAYNREEPRLECLGALFIGSDATLVSTIVSGNTCSLGNDLDIDGFNDAQVAGGDNLIGRSSAPVPADTITVTDPRLAPLAENGGPTRTRLPLADSPALERGSNPLNRAYDQRGPGFPRVRGAFPDIGAVER